MTALSCFSKKIDIWHVENNQPTSLLLWRKEKDRFNVIIKGDFATLLTNHDYMLIDKKFAELLTQISDQVTQTSVTITDPVLKTSTNHYIELRVKNSVDPTSIHSLDSKGLKIWKYNNHLFVSGGLKNKLTTIGDHKLNFSLGFSHFA